MKRKLWIILLSVIVLAILFLPIPKSPYKDGGTQEYAALTYKIVDWNRLTDDGNIYEATRIYFFPNNFRSIDNLWYYEKDNVPNMFVGKVVLIGDNFVEVEPLENEEERISTDRITIGTTNLENISVDPGSFVEITYSGEIMESYPAQINVISWKNAGNLQFMEYTDQWLDKQTAEKSENSSAHIRITKIYANCFFATNVIPLPYELKINGTLSEDWCVGDQVLCTYENVYYDWDNSRMEADMVSIDESDFELDPTGVYKPVIYLYPEEETDVTVELLLDGTLTCTYPAYKDGWKVTAAPDGTLTDAKGQTYNYLYWEGQTNAQWDMSKGFCVKGADTAAFLEDALQKLGLNRREANEFIVYWLPLMEQNPYNIISFQTDRYTDAAKLNISPAPDTTIRVFMTWQASENYISLPQQELTAPERTGFTVVEWGGTEVKDITAIR